MNSETKYANLVDSFKSRLQWKKASILKDQDKLSCWTYENGFKIQIVFKRHIVLDDKI